MFGIRLSGTERDLAALHTLADAAPALVSAPWGSVAGEDPPASFLCSPALDDALLRTRLVERGIAIAEAPPGEARPAAHLVEALRPIRLSGDPPCAEAYFLVPAESPEASALLERLLLLGRDDVGVAVLDGEGGRTLLVRTPEPPAYLLMRARDGADEAVRAFARQGERLLVAWGHAHPLPEVADRLAAEHGATVLVDAQGRWRSLPADLPLRSVYDVLRPELEAVRTDLVPAPDPDAGRFTLRMRLGTGPELDPELWLVTPEAFAALEDLVEVTPAERLHGVTVCRLEAPGIGIRYLVRERVRQGVPRLGRVLGDVLEQSGFALAAGTDNLYLPVRRRLLPAMRRDELRTMLELDAFQIVLVTEGPAGPRVERIGSVREEPLGSWIDLVAFDQRVELDRMLDAALFRFPGIQVQQPPGRAQELPRPAPPKRPRPAPAPQKRPQEEPEQHTEEGEEDLVGRTDEERRLRAAARVHEEAVAAGGAADPGVWAELAALKVAVDEPDDAATCYEAALFYGADPAPTARALAEQRARLVDPEVRALDLTSLALRETSPGQAALLGARVLDLLASGEALPEGLTQPVVQMFSEPSLTVGRRLAWAVGRAACAATGDRLGLTRVREAILGGMNTSGLDGTYDIPRFVRQTLALGASAQDRAAIEGAGQRGALDELWSRLTITDFDALSLFQRVIFATGYIRIGATGRARELVEPVEVELPVHDRPNRVLLQLYLTRMTLGEAQADEWQGEYDRVMRGEGGDPARIAAWFCKRSAWLRPEAPEAPEPWIRKGLERRVQAFEADPDRVPEELGNALGERSHYDYELVSAVQRGLTAAMGTGRDALMAEAVRAVADRVDRIGSLGFRARAIGAAVAAAATCSEDATVLGLLERIVEIVYAPEAPSIRELMLAVRPALLALRRLGASASASAFLRELRPMASSDPRRAAPLCALLAEGFLQLGEDRTANELLTLALDQTLDASLDDYAARDEAAAEVLSALKHWPMNEREPSCRLLLDNFSVFRDAFTARAYFPTYQLLLLERIVDAVVDKNTQSTDRVRSFLDAEELSIRRHIHAQWNETCGR